MQCRESHNEVDCLHFLWKLLEEHNIAETLNELSLFNPDNSESY